MPSPIIRVENLGKCYRIRHQSGGNGSAPRYRRLSEELMSFPRRVLSRFSPLATPASPNLASQNKDLLD